MTHARVKLLVGGLIVAGAVAYLAMAGVKEGWVYYMDVDKYLSDAKYQGQRVRLAGRVAEENVQSNPGLMSARFALMGPTRQVPVAYHGAIPDLFKAGADVVIEGRMDEDGLFQADVMMTKCASKYQAEEHAQRLESSPAGQPAEQAETTP